MVEMEVQKGNCLMIEVEVKLPISDKERVEQGLKSIGFILGKLLKESDIYYNSAVYDLKKKDMALRIRSCEDMISGKTKTVITYKGPKLDDISMTRKELETKVEDAEVLQEILSGIGFQPVCPVIKLRQYYHMNNMTACVDQVEKLGDFLELELIVEVEEERKSALIQIENILKTLGHDLSETTRTSYLSMLQKL